MYLAQAYKTRRLSNLRPWRDNLNRWYDPNVGRWISKDPIGFEAGDANLYRYVGNGPTNATDPSGLEQTFLIAQSPTGGSTTGTGIRITTSEPLFLGENGDFRWTIDWHLANDGLIAGPDGSKAYVLQEITYRVLVLDTTSGRDLTREQSPEWFKSRAKKIGHAWEVRFWEAWEFVPKGTWPGGQELPVIDATKRTFAPSEGRDDTYKNEGAWGGEGTRGFISIHGAYGLVQGSIPRNVFKLGVFGGAEPSGGAFSTWTDPNIATQGNWKRNHDLKVG